jgi:hypothetical protein
VPLVLAEKALAAIKKRAFGVWFGLNATVVTHEQLNLAARRKFLIPNVCQHFWVPFIDTFELLNALEARFVLGQ